MYCYVILNANEYNEKISHFLKENKFEKMDTDPTGGYQKQVNQAIQNSVILNNSQKWKLKNPKPTPPENKWINKIAQR
jgi:hypothetical protein